MSALPLENRKYVTKFGMTRGSTVDWHKESMKPLARCSLCIRQYGDAPKHDHLTVETIRGVSYLSCERHRREHARDTE